MRRARARARSRDPRPGRYPGVQRSRARRTDPPTCAPPPEIAPTPPKRHTRPWTPSFRDSAPLVNRLGPETARTGQLIIGYVSLGKGRSVNRVLVVLSPRNREESANAVPRAPHRVRSALHASVVRDRVRPPTRKPSENQGRKDNGPEDRSWGPLLIARSAKFARRFEWLRVRRRLQTRSRRSRRDGFAPLALSRKCERLRIQVVARRAPGRSP